MTRLHDTPVTHPLRNPHWASNHIYAQVMTHRGKNMVCLAFTQEQEDVLIATIRESGLDYRLTLTDGPARHYESRKQGHVASAYEDGLHHPRTERMIEIG